MYVCIYMYIYVYINNIYPPPCLHGRAFVGAKLSPLELNLSQVFVVFKVFKVVKVYFFH